MFSVLTNISQLGDIVPEVPLPIAHTLLTPTDLSYGIREEAGSIVANAQPALVNQINQMLLDSNIDYVYVSFLCSTLCR